MSIKSVSTIRYKVREYSSFTSARYGNVGSPGPQGFFNDNNSQVFVSNQFGIVEKLKSFKRPFSVKMLHV